VDIKDDYYQVTHRIKEAVTQSSLLIGGKLKEYQVHQDTITAETVLTFFLLSLAQRTTVDGVAL
jgi:hypothetical protein